MTEKNDKEFAMVHEQLVKLGQIKADAQLGKTRELSEKELALFNQLHETKVALEKNFQAEITAIQMAEAEKRARFNQENLNKFKSGKFQEINIADMTEKEKGQFVKDGARATLQEAAKMSKKMFRLNQALNIGEAIMNTAAGVTKALQQGGMFAIPMAVAIGAMGAIQVATIAAQQPPAMFGGARQAGSPFLVGERGPELFTPSSAGTVTPNNQLPNMATNNINFEIKAVDVSGIEELLNNNRATIVNLINSALNDQGKEALI